MKAAPVVGLIIIAATYAMAVLTFLLGGLPSVAAVYLGGTYALTALSSFLLARGILECFVSFNRDAAFFVAMRRLTDPLMAVVAPITPGFLVPFAAALYAAFLYFFLKLFLFGDAFLGVPPLFIVLFLVVMSLL